MCLRRSPRRGPHGAAILTWNPFPSRPTSFTRPGPVNDPGHSDSLVMIATVNASIANAPATTSAMAAASEVSAWRANPHCSRQDRRMSFQQWVGTNDDALCCCCMNMLSAGRAKIADCDAHEGKKVIGMQLSRLCVPRLHRAARGAVNCSRMAAGICSRAECRCGARRERAARKEEAAARRAVSRALPRIVLGECDFLCTTRTSCPTRRSCGEKEPCRELFPELFWGSEIFRRMTVAGSNSTRR